MPVELKWLPEHESWKQQAGALEDAPPADAWAAALALANSRINFIQTAKLDRLIRTRLAGCDRSFINSKPERLAVLASSTVDHLLPSIRVGAARREIWCETYTADYGQYMTELAAPDSGLGRFQPTSVLFSFDAHHLAAGAARLSTTQVAAQSLETIQRCWKMARSRFGCTLIQQTVLPVFEPLLGNNEHRMQDSPAEVVDVINRGIRASADDFGVHVLSIDRYAADDGLAAWFNPVFWHRAKQEVAPQISPFYGDLVARLLAAVQGRSRKCLVLDLDNTLWGGVIGDDGLGGIQLGQNSALGEAYLSFQKYVLRLAQRGVILAVCSKNDEDNAWAPFDRHTEMVLRRRDIACFCANWDDKASNLRKIAKTLNIGIDSLVFVDDNPFERAQVRRELPAVAVPELPDDPSHYAATVAGAGYFEGLNVTAEDRERASLYQANIERAKVLDEASDMAGYLQSLEMRLIYGAVDESNLKRVVQLINKTNQFNLTTKRYTEEAIRRLMPDAGVTALQFRLLDRFGDNGIISVVIGCVAGEAFELDTWLMSCRVLGRQVEEEVLNIIAAEAVSRGCTALIGRYLPTEKNGMVRNLYERLGFVKTEEAVTGATTWVRTLQEFSPASTFIRIEQESYAAN